MKPMTSIPKFSVGDKVTFFNDAGIIFNGKTITGVRLNPIRGWTYYITPTDSPWFDFNEKNLTIESN